MKLKEIKSILKNSKYFSKVEIEDENNIKIKNIDPSSIVTVYDYKEI